LKNLQDGWQKYLAYRLNLLLMKLQEKLETVPESSLDIEFEEPKILGGCLYVS